MRAMGAAGALALAVALGPGAASCGREVPRANGPAAATGPAATDTVVVAGRLEAGVECPALRGSDGRLYTLAGDLGPFGPGDCVRVAGVAAEVSLCMQGTTLSVLRVEASDDCGG